MRSPVDYVQEALSEQQALFEAVPGATEHDVAAAF